MEWDFNHVDPKAVGVVFNNIDSPLKATAEFGPHAIDPVKVVVATHGPEKVVLPKKNCAKDRHCGSCREPGKTRSKIRSMPQRGFGQWVRT